MHSYMLFLHEKNVLCKVPLMSTFQGMFSCRNEKTTVEPRYLELAYFELPLISK